MLRTWLFIQFFEVTEVLLLLDYSIGEVIYTILPYTCHCKLQPKFVEVQGSINDFHITQ